MHFVLEPDFPSLYPMGVRLDQLYHHLMKLQTAIKLSQNNILFHMIICFIINSKILLTPEPAVISARSRDAIWQHKKGLVQDLQPSIILLTVSLVTFHSISFDFLCEVEKSDRQGEGHCLGTS